jgi:hypothetical protein
VGDHECERLGDFCVFFWCGVRAYCVDGYFYAAVCVMFLSFFISLFLIFFFSFFNFLIYFSFFFFIIFFLVLIILLFNSHKMTHSIPKRHHPPNLFPSTSQNQYYLTAELEDEEECGDSDSYIFVSSYVSFGSDDPKMIHMSDM